MPDNMDALRVYYSSLRGTENAKNELIEDLLKRLDALSQDHQQLILDHDREMNYNRDGQKRELSLKEDLRLFRTMIVSHCGASHQTCPLTLTMYRSEINLSLSYSTVMV